MTKVVASIEYPQTTVKPVNQIKQELLEQLTSKLMSEKLPIETIGFLGTPLIIKHKLSLHILTDEELAELKHNAVVEFKQSHPFKSQSR